MNTSTNIKNFNMLSHEHGTGYISVNDEIELVTTDAFDNQLGNIYKFVKLISKTKGEAFSVVETETGGCEVIKHPPLSDYFDQMNAMIREFNPKLVYSPEIRLFFRVSNEINWPDLPFRPAPVMVIERGMMAEVFNQLVRKIRSEQSEKAYQEELRLRDHNVKRAHESATEYIDSLFMCFARLMVIRLDFGYPYRDDTYDQTRLEVLKADLKLFKKRMERSKVFENMCGYIFTIEYGLSKGHHLHAIFLFDGSKRHKDEVIAQEIGKIWVSASRNQGIFFNCNRNKSSYKNLGIGMINHYDKSKRKNLSEALSYLFKLEQLLTYRYKKKERTFFKGRAPDCNHRRSGRKRTIGLKNDRGGDSKNRPSA